jgi:hypothetical protein
MTLTKTPSYNRRHLVTLALVPLFAAGALSCGNDDGAQVRNLTESESESSDSSSSSNSGSSSASSSGSSSASEADTTETDDDAE